MRASYEQGWRSGEDYDSNPYEAFYTSSLTGYVSPLADGTPAFILDDLRKCDLSNRDRRRLEARVILLVGDDMDVSASGESRH